MLSEPPLFDALLDPADLDDVHTTVGAAIGAALAAAQGDIPAAFDAFTSATCGPDYRSVLLDVLGPQGLAQAESTPPSSSPTRCPPTAAELLATSPGSPHPVLLVQGGASPGATHRLIARLAAVLPDARVATLDGANHLLPLTHPAELADLIASDTREPLARA